MFLAAGQRQRQATVAGFARRDRASCSSRARQPAPSRGTRSSRRAVAAAAVFRFHSNSNQASALVREPAGMRGFGHAVRTRRDEPTTRGRPVFPCAPAHLVSRRVRAPPPDPAAATHAHPASQLVERLKAHLLHACTHAPGVRERLVEPSAPHWPGWHFHHVRRVARGPQQNTAPRTLTLPEARIPNRSAPCIIYTATMVHCRAANLPP
jgi:hypothetical protein